MGDTNIEYDGKFGINTFKREICAELGDEFWNTLIDSIELPDIEKESSHGCHSMFIFMKRFEELADKESVKKILCRVRHGINPSCSAWAHKELEEFADLDLFLAKHLTSEQEKFVKLNQEKTDFFGQMITDKVLTFLYANPEILAPVRKGNKLHCKAFPENMDAYLNATSDKEKRYHLCECPYAKESILSENNVSPALCNCSLGHVMNFAEALLDKKLNGRVIRSALNGDLICEYEIDIPDDIMEKYVHE